MSDPRLNPDELWARFRLAVIAGLLARKPRRGELAGEVRRLASESWTHPVTGEPVRLGASTIERWYYAAREATNPLAVLRRKVRSDRGQTRSLPRPLIDALRCQHARHFGWSYQLHHDNLKALAEGKPELGPVPSYTTVRRFMKSHGLIRRPRRRGPRSPGEARARHRLETREVRSFESEFVHGLWHADFHEGSLPVLTSSGEWVKPQLLAILDDRSRVVCHAQWYLDETAATFVHGLSQALLKHGLPRMLMTDNGSAMKAGEVQQGLEDLGIQWTPTLPHSPYQNGKQEAWWGQVEGRLLSMLETAPDLDLSLLNRATQAWVDREYHRTEHSEIKTTPLTRLKRETHVSRPDPGTAELARAFTVKVRRTQRLSDGTLTLAGTRYEVPSAYRHLRRLLLRHASWDRSRVFVADERTGKVLAPLFPVNRAANADRRRRKRAPVSGPSQAPDVLPEGEGLSPLMKKYLREYAATGLPPAYLPRHENDDERTRS